MTESYDDDADERVSASLEGFRKADPPNERKEHSRATGQEEAARYQ